MPLKYLFDENVDPEYVRQLRRQNPNLVVRMVGEPATPTKGILDPEILVWCEATGFVLVTNNRRSMPVHLMEHIAQCRHIPGIFILNPNLSMGETLEDLILVAEAALDDEYQDRIEYLPLTW
ncbi:DUF5615 family PIN-like protein [Chlorogloeopsis sp. ULAP01]|jgi:hypothetical protein|uniref:DUF5615 family PIN-like protein n=1 Tax=Chlorogloeopsis sp. ULAP01 TaxID=3056483 RepID=UPI0025AAE294|nr:DUF5615 family PIN-like protein [Chlorogloeopsis sp. ULAP01]MDM9379858.1 DUF5615 family PIN-like protein [Chlorogloeopsis sp. ULAP01]